MGTPRPVVPLNVRRTIFDALHKLSHPGIRATQHLVTQGFNWPGMNKDVPNWARVCLVCTQSMVHRHTRAPFASFTLPSQRFDKVRLDILGPRPPSNGNTNLLTCIDRFTRWPSVLKQSQTCSSRAGFCDMAYHLLLQPAEDASLNRHYSITC